MKLIQGDCLEQMDKLIAEGVKVDAIITDPPYGTTACKWDSVIPFEPMWERLNKLIKDNGAIVLFGSEPFSSALRMSNIKDYRYDWIWEKSHPTGFALSKKRPLKYHENLSVYYTSQPTYNPQMWDGKPNHGDNNYLHGKTNNAKSQPNMKAVKANKDGRKYPKDIQKFNSHNRADLSHPTQKSLPLMEYLIKTYTNEDNLVLDFTMGSGTTGVACKNLNRDFIGIELDDKYFEIAKERINHHTNLIN